jgi:hypothetical protein
MKILDLCSGTGSATKAFKDRGHVIVTVDVVPPADILSDVRLLDRKMGKEFDVVWASPPCQEFSVWNHPFHTECRKLNPDLSIVHACMMIGSNAPIFILENVQALQFWLGASKYHAGPYHLWFDVPKIPKIKVDYHKREHWQTPEQRAMIPYELSEALCVAIEQSDIGGD